MKKWFASLNTDLKTCFISAVIISVACLLTLPLIAFDLLEIPLGVLLGGFLNIVYYLASGLNRKRGENQKVLNLDIALIIIRFILVAAVCLVVAFLSFKMNIKIFNLFSLLGAYLVPILIFGILSRKEVQ